MASKIKRVSNSTQNEPGAKKAKKSVSEVDSESDRSLDGNRGSRNVFRGNGFRDREAGVNYDVEDISAKVKEVNARHDAAAEAETGGSSSSSKTKESKVSGKPRAKIVALYNFKGGVGKTSNLINIAGMLTLQPDHDDHKHGLNKRVLMVDADPQCNLTTFFTPNPPEDEEVSDSECEEVESDDKTFSKGRRTGPGFSKVGQKAPRKGELSDKRDKEVDSSEFKRGNELQVLEITNGFLNKAPYFVKNIYQLLDPVFGNYINEFSAPERVFKVSDALPGLYLIPGDPQIASFESKVALARSQPDVAVAYLGGFRKLLLDTAEALDIDVVLVDFGPSASQLMKVLLLSCDFILPPVFTDYFSLSSMDGLLTRVLPDMIEEHRQILSDQRNEARRNPRVRQQISKGFGFHDRVPRLLPFIVSNFNVYRQSITTSSSVFVSSMHALMQSDAAKVSNEARVPESVQDLYTREKGLMVVALCKQLGSLQQIAQKTGYPPVAHTQDQLAVWQDKTKFHVRDMFFNSVLYARHKYSSFIKFLMKKCDELD